MITVCSARLTYGGTGRLDITRAAADRSPTSPAPLFAPSTNLFRLGKSRAIPFGEYARRYEAELEKTWGDSLFRGLAVLALASAGPRVVGVCYCVEKEGVLCCHRTVWRSFLVRVGPGAFVDGGELPEEEQRRVIVAKPSNQGRLF